MMRIKLMVRINEKEAALRHRAFRSGQPDTENIWDSKTTESLQCCPIDQNSDNLQTGGI
jgi:hypothetical protein